MDDNNDVSQYEVGVRRKSARLNKRTEQADLPPPKTKLPPPKTLLSEPSEASQTSISQPKKTSEASQTPPSQLKKTSPASETPLSQPSEASHPNLPVLEPPQIPRNVTTPNPESAQQVHKPVRRQYRCKTSMPLSPARRSSRLCKSSKNVEDELADKGNF